MKATFARTWITVALAAGIGGYAYFVESRKPASDAEPKEKVFEALAADQISELDVAGAGRESVHLVRQDGGWRITAPREVDADAQEADSLASSFAGLELDAVVAEGETDLAQFGLAEPRLVVQALPRGATEPLELMIGDSVPAGGGVYARVPSQARVFTVASFVESTFDKKPFDLRDRDVLRGVERDAIQSLLVEGPGPRLALERSHAEEWAFTEPIATRAGRWAVDGVVGALANLRMEAVASESATPDQLKTYGLDPPRRRVVLGLGEAGEKILEIGTTTDDGKHHARAAGSSLVVVIEDSLVKELDKGLDGLRAKRLISAATYQVVGFDATRGGVRARYERSGGEGGAEATWRRTEPEAKDVTTDAVQDLLYKLGGIDAQGFVDEPSAPAEYGLDAPELRIELRQEDGAPVEWVEIGRHADAAFARRSDDTAVLRLDPKDVDELIAKLDAL